MTTLPNVRATVAVAVTAVSLALGTVALGTPVAAAERTEPPGWRQEMLEQVNAARQAAGAPPLTSCSSLQRAAQQHAEHLAGTQSLDHVGPDGTLPWDRMQAQGFIWRAAAENLAVGPASVQQTVLHWSDSPGHRANLLDPRMRQVGFGFADDPSGPGRGYWVQDLARGRGC